jgi:ParB family chromosome partitioning protein
MPKLNYALQMSELTKAKGGEFVENLMALSIDKIRPNAKNFYSMSDIELLAEDIERQGLKSNLVVREDSDGSYTIISGHRRYQALMLLIAEKRLYSRLVPCLVNPTKNDDDELLDLIMLNSTTRVINDAEMLEQYERLKGIFERKKASGEKFGRIREKIAEVLNISTTQVGRIETIVKNATPEIRKAVQNGEMSIRTASETRKNVSRGTQNENCVPVDVKKDCVPRDTKSKTGNCDQMVTKLDELLPSFTTLKNICMGYTLLALRESGYRDDGDVSLGLLRALTNQFSIKSEETAITAIQELEKKLTGGTKNV